MKLRILTALLLVGLTLFGLLGTASAQGPWSQFDGILADEVVATVSVTAPDMAVSDDLTVTDRATVGNIVSTSSNLGASSVTSLSSTGLASLTRVALAQGSQQTITAGAVITSATSLVQITAAGVLSSGNIYTGTDGQILIVVNAGTNAITVPDSGLNRLSAAAVLGQYDTLTVVWYNGGWTQLSTSNN